MNTFMTEVLELIKNQTLSGKKIANRFRNKYETTKGITESN
ncbi:hypothetical protein P278_27980 [Zhouia amylolytica AD3]|uniref:Uncharacterized protein n=1 Tax=Zhouia amylolytica AD3 TaxID=1286632 RepID=W2UL29_9FLAO|nr:hypothetical protein P278_27980 [Zhouia amylolytica AD3]